jgi:hypothetical protein
MKLEEAECSEMSAYKIQNLGIYPEESVRPSEHGENLKSRGQIASVLPADEGFMCHNTLSHSQSFRPAITAVARENIKCMPCKYLRMHLIPVWIKQIIREFLCLLFPFRCYMFLEKLTLCLRTPSCLKHDALSKLRSDSK